MSTTPKRQVHPAASALFIMLTLAGVQWVWWRFLVYRPQTPAGPMRAGPAGGGPPQVTVIGRPDVTVDSFAGQQVPGDADGPGHAARFDRPTGLALDSAGSLYVADTGNHRIRKISPEGDTITFAGGEPGYADGPAAQAKFSAPCGVSVGPDGAVYVADAGNHCIRRILNGQVSTLAGRPDDPAAPANGPGSKPRPLTLPIGVAAIPGARPALLVADAGAGSLLRFGLDGTLESTQKIAGPPVAVAASPKIAVAMPASGALALGAETLRDTPIDTTETLNADQAKALRLHHPVGVWPVGDGWLVTDNGHRAVLMVFHGKAEVIAGRASSGGQAGGSADGKGSAALFGTVSGVVTDGKRYAYVSDTSNNTIRRLDISALYTH